MNNVKAHLEDIIEKIITA